MKLKQISMLAFLVVLVLLVLACNTTTGANNGQPPAPEAPAEEIAVEPTPFPDTKEVATLDLKPDGCDMVCVLGSYLGLND
jgi:hypothetical protein